MSASGTTTTTLGGLTLEENHYTQRYRYDVIGNMTAKTSTNRIMPSVETPAHLNYDLTYTYDPVRPHQARNRGFQTLESIHYQKAGKRAGKKAGKKAIDKAMREGGKKKSAAMR